MKRRTLAILLACCLALCASVALVACGGGGSQAKDSRTDCIWFKADIPEGAEVSSYGGTANVATIKFENDADDWTIQMDRDKKPLDEAAAYRPTQYPDRYTAGEDITVGGRTWKVVNFEWNGKPSVMLYSDLGGDEIKTAHIDAFELTPDSEVLKSFLESLEYADNIDDAYNEAVSVKIADFRSEKGLK